MGILDSYKKKPLEDQNFTSGLPQQFSAPAADPSLVSPDELNSVAETIRANAPNPLGDIPTIPMPERIETPKELLPDTTGHLVKDRLMNMIPFYGPARAENEYEQKAQVSANYNYAQAAQIAEYKQQVERQNKMAEQLTGVTTRLQAEKLDRINTLRIVGGGVTREMLYDAMNGSNNWSQFDPVEIKTTDSGDEPIYGYQNKQGHVKYNLNGQAYTAVPGDGKVIWSRPVTAESMKPPVNPYMQRGEALANPPSGVSRDEMARIVGAAEPKDTAGQSDLTRYIGWKKSEGDKRPDSEIAKEWRLMANEFGAGPAAAGRNDTRVDRSYQYHNSLLETAIKPVNDAMGRFERLEETIAANTPQADALVAPELLTVMAGGMGSGLRMNEAEIARIIGGRSNWETLQAAVNKWKSDPSKALTITPAQRVQIRSLMAAVKTKMQARQRIINDARDKLVMSEDPMEHRRIYAQAQKDLAAGQQPIKVVRDANGKLVQAGGAQ